MEDEGGEPDGQGRVGLKEGGAVGVAMGAEASGGKEEPELVVAGLGVEGEEDAHAGGGKGKGGEGEDGRAGTGFHGVDGNFPAGWK